MDKIICYTVYTFMLIMLGGIAICMMVYPIKAQSQSQQTVYYVGTDRGAEISEFTTREGTHCVVAQKYYGVAISCNWNH